MALKFAGTSLGTLQDKEQIKVRQVFDLDLAIALELKLREEREREMNSRINQRHHAYASAFPLRQYIYETFPLIEKGRDFRNNWHIDAIAELLQAVTLGEVRNFIINIPRRCSKSTLVCVMWPTWVWTFLPSSRWLFTSYSQNFARRDNEKCSLLIKSKYYQERWGSTVKITTDRKDKIENTAGGFRAVFRIGKGTGEGGDFVIADDPNAIDEMESELVLTKTNIGWNEVSYHNVTDRNTAVRGIIQQRTGSNDVTGHIIEDDQLSALYQHLCLAMRFEADHPYYNSISKPLYLGKVSVYEKAQIPHLEVGEEKLWVDPRCETAPTFDNQWYQHWYQTSFIQQGLETKGEGQLLWENYIDEKIIAEEVAHLKAYGENSQYQQRPIKRGGNFFQSKDFLNANGKPISPEQLRYDNKIYCRYWDKAGTEGGGDWTVGMLVSRTTTRPYIVHIIDIIRVQVGYHERMELMVQTATEDYKNYVEPYENTEYSIGIEIEGASAGKDLATLEREALAGYDIFLEKPKGSKGWRALATKSIAESGRLKIVTAPWNMGFLKRLEAFDPLKLNQKDDEIDALSGAIRKLFFHSKNGRTSTSGY